MMSSFYLSSPRLTVSWGVYTNIAEVDSYGRVVYLYIRGSDPKRKSLVKLAMILLLVFGVALIFSVCFLTCNGAQI